MKLPLLWRKIQTGNCNWDAQASDPSMWQSAVKTFSWCVRKKRIKQWCEILCQSHTLHTLDSFHRPYVGFAALLCSLFHQVCWRLWRDGENTAQRRHKWKSPHLRRQHPLSLCKHQGRRWCCCHAHFLLFCFFVVIFQDFVKVSKPTGEICGWKWTLCSSHGLIKAQLKKLKPHWASTRAWKDCRPAAFPRSLHRQVKFS